MKPQKRKTVHKTSYNEIRDNMKNDKRETSRSFETENDSSSEELSEEETLMSHSQQNRTYNLRNKPQINYSSTKQKNILIITVIIGLLLYSICQSLTYVCNTKHDKLDKIHNLQINIKSNKISYQNQEKDFWKLTFASIVNIIEEPEKPSIIILLGNETSTLFCLAYMLATISSDTLNTGILELTPEKFEPDLGSVISLLTKDTETKKVVIIDNLLNVNTEAIRAFHNLCDRINPLVKDIILIITINIDTYDENKSLSPVKVVENQLVKKLSNKIKADSIQPLITRITDGHILLTNPEPYKNVACPLPVIKKTESELCAKLRFSVQLPKICIETLSYYYSKLY